MKKLKPQMIRLIASSTSAVVCLGLLIVSMFAWYVTNKTAYVSSGTGVTSDCNYIHFTDTVTAVKYAVNGSETYTTYDRSDKGVLTLSAYESYPVASVDENTDFDGDTAYYIKSGGTFSSASSYIATETYYTHTVYSETDIENLDNKSFLFSDNLPGDHVDITIGYYMDDEMNGSAYNIRLQNVTGGSFVVDGKTHYSVGVFNYKSMSLKHNDADVSGFVPYQAVSITSAQFTTDGTLYTYDSATGAYTQVTSGTYSSSASYYTSDYTYFYKYAIGADDASSTTKVIMNGTWTSGMADSDNPLYYTFSIEEDFTAYYDLVGQASGSYSNLLNSLRFSIGNVMIMQG